MVDVAERLDWIDADGNTNEMPAEWAMAGRFLPPVDLIEHVVPNKPGARLDSVRHGARSVDLPLWLIFDTANPETNLRVDLRNWMGRLDPIRGDGTLRVTAPDGTVRDLTCRATRIETPEIFGDDSGPGVQRVLVTLRAVDPYLYATADSSGMWSLGQSTGAFFPFLPHINLSSSEVFATATIDNQGDGRRGRR